MKIRNKDIPPFLLAAKIVKVFLISISFRYPTIKAKIVLKLLECSYGMGLKVCGKVYFRPNGKGTISLGDNVRITSRFLTNTVGITNPVMLECIEKGKIKIGNNSGITSAIISSRESIQIGNNVNIGGNVRIYDHDFHSTNYLHRRTKEDTLNVKSSGIIIEDDVFVGTNTIILKGVHIGARSIIAAGSVVICRNIPADSLVAGNPAKIIKSNINALNDKE